MSTYPCNGCNEPITKGDSTVLTGIRDGNRVCYHTQYPVGLNLTDAAKGILFVSGFAPCSVRFEQGLENPQTISFSEFEKLVKAESSKLPIIQVGSPSTN